MNVQVTTQPDGVPLQFESPYGTVAAAACRPLLL
jgi:hypothetical protein